MSKQTKNNRNKGKKAKGGNTSGSNSPNSNDRQVGTGDPNSEVITPTGVNALSTPSPPTGDVPVIANKLFHAMDENLKDALEETEHVQGRGTEANLGSN